MSDAAVDGDDGAAHVRTQVGGEEDDHRRHLIDRGRAAVRHLGEALLPTTLVTVKLCRALAAEHLDTVGQDRTRIYPDHAHAEVEAVAADGAGERHQAGVAHRARDVPDIEAFAAKSDDIDDHALAALFHLFQIMPG